MYFIFPPEFKAKRIFKVHLMLSSLEVIHKLQKVHCTQIVCRQMLVSFITQKFDPLSLCLKADVITRHPKFRRLKGIPFLCVAKKSCVLNIRIPRGTKLRPQNFYFYVSRIKIFVPNFVTTALNLAQLIKPSYFKKQLYTHRTNCFCRFFFIRFIYWH